MRNQGFNPRPQAAGYLWLTTHAIIHPWGRFVPTHPISDWSSESHRTRRFLSGVVLCFL